MKYRAGDLVKFDDINLFQYKHYGLSYDVNYEIKTVYSCGSFEVIDDLGYYTWIDVSKHGFVDKIN